MFVQGSLPIIFIYLFSFFSTSLRSSLPFLFLFLPSITGDRALLSFSFSSSLDTELPGEHGGLCFSGLQAGGEGGDGLVERCSWGWTTAVGSLSPLLRSWRPSRSSCCLSGSAGVDGLESGPTFGWIFSGDSIARFSFLPLVCQWARSGHPEPSLITL